MVDSYEPGDLRLPASIAVAEGNVANEVLTTQRLKALLVILPPRGWVLYFMKKDTCIIQ